jgi:hypothetical protein
MSHKNTENNPMQTSQGCRHDGMLVLRTAGPTGATCRRVDCAKTAGHASPNRPTNSAREMTADNRQDETANSQPGNDAALILGVAHVLTTLGTAYQVGGGLEFDRFFFVNYTTFLSPLVVLFFSRRVPNVLALYAIPILSFFSVRMYYVWQFYWLGINSMAVQKGDGLAFLTMLFDMASLLVGAFLLLVRMATYVVDAITRSRWPSDSK